jgi:transcriptional regulator with XRE-family HTH domain
MCSTSTFLCASLTYRAKEIQNASMDDMDVYLQFGRKVAAARKGKGMTQADLAKMVSLTRASVANIETGRQRVMLHDVFAIVAALGGRSILEFVPERIAPESMRDVAFVGDGASKEDEIAMLQMIELATAGARS